MTEQWQELKETITEMRDNDGTATQQEVCKFLANYMDILEKQMQQPCEDCISRQAVRDRLHVFVNEMEAIFSDIREKNVDDSVCGLCEYDCDHGADGYANECPGFERDDCFKLKDEYRKEWESIKDLPSVKPKAEWIPCSERLPELNRPLLVTAYHRVCYAHMISESGNYGYPVFRLHEIKDSDRGWVQETISHEPYSKGRIDAWIYIDIPEPYKVEPQESEESDG